MDKEKDSRRGTRRARTLRIARKNKKLHMRTRHPDGKPDCVCELSAFYFEKWRALGCRCSKKTHGQPKRGHGPCMGGEKVRPTVLGRLRFRAFVAHLVGRSWASIGEQDSSEAPPKVRLG